MSGADKLTLVMDVIVPSQVVQGKRTGHRILYLSIRYFERVQAVALSDGTDGRAGEAAGCVACPPRPRLPARFPSRRARRDWQASPSFTTLAEFVTPSAAVLLLLLDLLDDRGRSRPPCNRSPET